MVNAHSKWPEVVGPMKTTTAEATTNAMHSIFARFGLPGQIVSDNGPPFLSVEYQEFSAAKWHPEDTGLSLPSFIQLVS